MAATPPGMVATYKARYRLNMGTGFREFGQLVPEAHTWFRRESYLHTGRLAETTVPKEEFLAAVDEFCPELKERLIPIVGLDPDVVLNGPHRTPRRRVRKSSPRAAEAEVELTKGPGSAVEPVTAAPVVAEAPEVVPVEPVTE